MRTGTVILRREDAEGSVSHMRNGSFAALRRLRMTAAPGFFILNSKFEIRNSISGRSIK
jgi:hypothetical protein